MPQFELAQGKAKASVWKLGSSLHAAGGRGRWPPWSRMTPNALLGQGRPGLHREGGGRAPALCHYLIPYPAMGSGSRPMRAVAAAAEGRPRTRLLVAQREKRLPAMWETWAQSLGQGVPLEKEMATHSSILAWEIPWTEEPGGLQSMGLQKVRHD